jgi:hypothetical protein
MDVSTQPTRSSLTQSRNEQAIIQSLRQLPPANDEAVSFFSWPTRRSRLWKGLKTHNRDLAAMPDIP